MDELHHLRAAEKRLLERLHEQGHVARDVHAEEAASRTLGERLADDLAHFAGSWRFILLFLGACALWAFLNATELVTRAWDPYPFILLNLFLSLLAGLQAPVIMMSQNRQEERDRLRSQADYEVNLKAELEIEQLHGKLDDLREQRWAELIAIQQQQIRLLHQQVELLQALSRGGGLGEAARSE
jgi:uncharacterized membrane protein